MTIDQIHTFIRFLANQGQGRYFTPEEIDQAVNAAQIDKYNEEKRQYVKTREITDNLRVFLTFADITLTAGVGVLPSDYDYLIWFDDKNSKFIENVEPNEFYRRSISEIELPSTDSPIARIVGSNVRVRPSTISLISINYLKKPTDVVWGYTVSGSDLIYDSGSSTQLQWPDTTHNDIVLRSCVYLGIPLDDKGLLQLKSFKKQTENV